MPIRRLDKTLTATTATVAGEDIAANSIPVKPHIQYGILQPALAGKDLSGTALGGSYTYGTAHTDGHSYYYTDIKGSTPIKDPRIGAHFGSQRHMFKSMQTLETETSTHGDKVYSIDGREWIRGVGDLGFINGTGGVYVRLEDATTSFFEITGYFNAFNYIGMSSDSSRPLKIEIDGVTAHATFNPNGSVNSPLGIRYVSSGSVFNVDITSSSSLSSDTALGIHTIRISYASGYGNYPTGIELIAQDTTSTANKSKIQIPSQNVVSYGKKFTVSGTPHYDPFNGFTNGTTLFSANVDTATSLGLGTGTTWGAPWAISSSNHIRPFNGGRVVKWVDSSGTIKTSVTMMPRNAQNIGNNNASGSAGVASNEITTASATNAHTINFSDDVIENSLSEVAKDYYLREFGNGAANGGTGATYADFSMLNATDNVAYVMDDGLTSASGNSLSANGEMSAALGGSEGVYITFIGTGISWKGWDYASANQENIVIAQNLPYGTHIAKIYRDGSNGMLAYVDNIQVYYKAGANNDNLFQSTKGFAFHQPKKPPVPEDACILADYMLMADFVAQTSEGVENVSKGVRLIAPSRDMFYDRSAGSFHPGPFVPEIGASQFHINCWQGNASGTETRILPVFGDSFCMTFATNSDTNTTAMPLTAGSAGTTALNNWTLTSGGSSVTSLSAAGSLVSAASNAKGFVCAKAGASVDLGIQQLKSVGTIASGGYHYQRTFGVHTPIHTSSHYQEFETPFLKELVGGDRNMEQNNLIVTADGKSWDEVTRDTSYIGNLKVVITTSAEDPNNDLMFKEGWDDWRGTHTNVIYTFNKDFAIAYDRVLCLVGGWYQFRLIFFTNSDISSSDWAQIRINNNRLTQSYQHDTSELKVVYCSASGFVKRGDHITIHGAARGGDEETCRFEITKLEK